MQKHIDENNYENTWLTENLVREVQLYYSKKYSIEITEEEAIEIAVNLTNFVELTVNNCLSNE